MGTGEGGLGFWRWWVSGRLASLCVDAVWEQVAHMLPVVRNSCSRALKRSWAVSSSCSEYLFSTASRHLVAAPAAVLEPPAISSEAYPSSMASNSAAFSFRHASFSLGLRCLVYQRTPADQPTYRYSSSHLMYATSLPHLLHPHLRLLERPLGLYVGSRKMPLRLRGHRR